MPRLTGQALRSTVSSAGEVTLALVEVELPDPAPDEVVIEVQAAPLNPSDQLLMFGGADPASFRPAPSGGVSAPVPAARLPAMAGRLDQAQTLGNEGAGRVVQAGSASGHLLGRLVAFRQASYSQYRLVKADECRPLPEGVSARDGAAAWINPLTVLGMTETLRREGHSALVHTAAASNVGQMLVRLCQADAIPLVNIVRSEAQAALLRDLGAEHVVDSSREDFRERLVAALHATGATLAFDAIGGGGMAATILAAMETVLVSKLTGYSRYGSPVHKQVYIYGALDPGPRIIQGDLGLAWGVGGWLMTYFYQRLGGAETRRLHDRVMAELTTTFASAYTAEISLEQALDPAVIAAYARRATGEKYLIVPNRPD